MSRVMSVSSLKNWGGGGTRKSGELLYCMSMLFCVSQHRISTIKQYDRVMVLDNGFLLEFAPPTELLADPHSLFYSLANAGINIDDAVTHKSSIASSQNE